VGSGGGASGRSREGVAGSTEDAYEALMNLMAFLFAFYLYGFFNTALVIPVAPYYLITNDLSTYESTTFSCLMVFVLFAQIPGIRRSSPCRLFVNVVLPSFVARVTSCQPRRPSGARRVLLVSQALTIASCLVIFYSNTSL
jgi:MFS family permease